MAGITDSGQCFSRTREFAVRKHWARSNVAVDICWTSFHVVCFLRTLNLAGSGKFSSDHGPCPNTGSNLRQRSRQNYC